MTSKGKSEKENSKVAIFQNNGIQLLTYCKITNVPPTILTLYVMK
jgi:hypothetical protein